MDCTDMHKNAAEAAETALEQNFADLANARLRDKSPALLDYLVGFQLIKADDDGSKAVGIFGFEIGDSWHYAPAFFLNGEIKGLDSIYSVESDLFVPLSEDWVNQIINRRPNHLGEADTKSRDERGTRLPNYTRLRQMPGGAGDNGSMNKMSCVKVAEKMVAGRDDAVESLPGLIASMGPEVAQGFIADIAKHPKLAALVDQFYDFTDFFVPTAKTAAKKDEDVTIISNIAQSGADKLSDEDKKQLVAGGVAVVDKRPEMAKSIVYRTETSQQLQNPTDGGLYDVLMSDGDIKTMLLFKVLGSTKMLAYEPESGKHGMMETKNVWTVRQHEPALFREKLEKESIKPDAVRPRDCVIFVNTSGDSTLGFEIDEVSTGADDIKVLKLRYGYWLAGDCSDHAWDRFSLTGPAPWRYGTPSQRIKEVLVTDAGSGAIRYTAKRLTVNNKRFCAVVLNKLGSGDSDFSYKSDLSDIQLRSGDFGDHQTIRAALSKVASEMKVWTNGRDIVINDQHASTSYTEISALSHLIRKQGCDADTAFQIIKEASSTPKYYHVKQAGELLPFPQVEDESESGDMSSYHRTKVPTRGIEQKTPDENRDFYQYNSPFAGFSDDGTGESPVKGDEKQTKSTVQRAAQTGQKDVFDASILGSLIKSHNPTELVERFLPTIVSGMDRLGRLLFLLHWHYEEFSDRYGKQDLIEFQDNLRSCFESLGDLVIFMRRRTLSGDPEFYGLGMNSTMEG